MNVALGGSRACSLLNKTSTKPTQHLICFSSPQKQMGNRTVEGKSWVWVSSVCQLNSDSWWLDQPNQGRQVLSAASAPRVKEISKVV